MIDEMTYSWINATAIREEMDQFNDTIKLFMSAHEEYQSSLTDEEQVADSEWYDQFDEVFSFKRKMVKWLKEAELNNEEVKSRMSYKSGSSRSCKSGSSKSSSKSGNSRGSKVSMEERAIEENIRLAEVIAEANYADQKIKMEYDRKKLEIEERVAKAKAKVLSTFGDVSLQKCKEEDQLLNEDNRKNKKTPLLRKDPVFRKNETKIEDQKFSHRSRLNYDCKGFIPGKKYFPDYFLQSKNHEVNKNYDSDGEVSPEGKFQGAPEVDIDTFSGDPLEYHYFMEVFKEVVEEKIEDPRGRLTRLIKYTAGEAKDLIKHCIQQPSAEGYENAMELLK